MFRLNWAQQELYNNLHTCNIVLKVRQIGITTFFNLLLLDKILWEDNIQAGIIAQTLDAAKDIFQDKIKFAFDHLDPEIKALFRPVGDSAKELAFENGSVIRVGTSLRSSTLQYLHISEFGKICAKTPERAKEIVTGSLNTVAAGQHIFIESTAEGSAGYFHDMYKQAVELESQKVKLTALDYKPFFLPWWKEPTYKLGEFVIPDKETQEYFTKLSLSNIELSGAQQAWYIKKKASLGDEIFQEYPSTPEEAFRGSASGLFYGKLLLEARLSKRIGSVPYDRHSLVHTAWDLGYGDYTAIWWYQLIGNEIHLIDFYQDNGKSLAEYIHQVKSRGYTYGEHIAPFDIQAHEYTHGQSRWEVAKKLGINFTVAPKVTIIEGIDSVKALFPRFWIDETKCKEGLNMLENYRREWDERLVKWSEKPVHDYASHGADALRMLAVGMPLIAGGRGDMKTDASALRKYWGG